MTCREAAIDGWPGYSITDEGHVFSTRYRGVGGAKTKLSEFSDGRYICVNLTRKVDGQFQRKKMLVHRLVCQAFLPNPEHKKAVNHRDGNPSNNHLSNLEWCTHSENSRHSIDVLKRWPKGSPKPKGDASIYAKKVHRYLDDWTYDRSFGSFVSAGESIGLCGNQVWKAIKRNGKSGGYRWSYLGPDEIKNTVEQQDA